MKYILWVWTTAGYQRIVCNTVKEAVYLRDSLRSIEDWNYMI